MNDSENVLEGTQEGESPVELCRICISTQKKAGNECTKIFHQRLGLLGQIGEDKRYGFLLSESYSSDNAQLSGANPEL